MRPIPGTRTAQIVVIVLVLAVVAVAVWAVGAARSVSDDELAGARVRHDVDVLLASQELSELPGPQQQELRDELQTQRDALPEPSRRALERVSEGSEAAAGDDGGGPHDLPGRLLESAQTLLRSPAGSPQEQALHTSVAAHRVGTAVELGADPATALRAVPELGAEDALPAPEEDETAPSAAGDQPHPELALARQLDQLREAGLTWGSLPPEQRPSSTAHAEAVAPLRDGAWWDTVATRHPSVIDGAPGMPQEFRSAPDEAQERLLDALEDTALAQTAAGAEDSRTTQAPASAGAGPGRSVLVRLTVADAQESRPIAALPGLGT